MFAASVNPRDVPGPGRRLSADALGQIDDPAAQGSRRLGGAIGAGVDAYNAAAMLAATSSRHWNMR